MPTIVIFPEVRGEGSPTGVLKSADPWERAVAYVVSGYFCFAVIRSHPHHQPSPIRAVDPRCLPVVAGAAIHGFLPAITPEVHRVLKP